MHDDANHPGWQKGCRTMSHIDKEAADELVARYVAVWSEPGLAARQAAVAELWKADGAEFVESTAFRGRHELSSRIAQAHQEFVASGRYLVSTPGDVSCHADIVVFTIQLVPPGREIAWAARVFLLLDVDGSIREDFQLTVVPLTDQA